MKRLITLIASAVLLCPILAGAQTTPTVAGTLTWTLNPGPTTGEMTFTSPQVGGGCPESGGGGAPVQFTCSTTGVANLVKLVATVLNYASNTYNLSAQVTFNVYSSVTGKTDPATYAAMGSMIYWNNGQYMMTILASNYSMDCYISTSTLNGTCQAANKSQSPITLVTN